MYSSSDECRPTWSWRLVVSVDVVAELTVVLQYACLQIVPVDVVAERAVVFASEYVGFVVAADDLAVQCFFLCDDTAVYFSRDVVVGDLCT